MEKEVVEILLDIKKELQAIRSCLEPNTTLSIEKISQKVQEHFQEVAGIGREGVRNGLIKSKNF